MEEAPVGDSSLAQQCLVLCQTLANQGRTFSLSLTTSFIFSMDSNGLAAPAQVVKKKSSPSTQCQMKTTVPENEAGFLFWDEGSKWVSLFCFHCCGPFPVIFCDAGWRKTFSVWSVSCSLCVKAWPEVSHWIYTHNGLHAIIFNVHTISTSISSHTKHSSKHSLMWSVY